VNHEFNPHDFSKTFKEMDLDGNGYIDREEMVEFLDKIW
jgi:Ca2+-binding EF-hand superfamily protein